MAIVSYLWNVGVEKRVILIAPIRASPVESSSKCERTRIGTDLDTAWSAVSLAYARPPGWMDSLPC